MSKPTGGPAFPGIEKVVTGIDSDGVERVDIETAGGMTLRDYFAAKALGGMLADPQVTGAPEKVAEIAYIYADAMLAERNKGE